ncbi:MAG: hypothetical protein Q9170_006378 [Blastenia crenularia]
MIDDQKNQAKKKATIDDFFVPNRKETKLPKSINSAQGNDEEKVSGEAPSKVVAVPGLSLFGEFVTRTEEKEILNFLNDSTRCTWRTDLSRRTMHFGGTFCLMPRKNDVFDQAKLEIVQAPELPPELHWLVQRLIDRRVYEDGQRPQYCIVNEYTGNLGISAHTENFQFGEPVVGLSLLSGCPIRFHELAVPSNGSVRSGKAARARKTGRVADVQLPPRSLLVMNGPSRWSWQHEIVRSGKGRGPDWKRVSLTFRFKP